MWLSNRSDRYWQVASQKMTRSLKFRILEEEGLHNYFTSSENKGADQLRSYPEADLRLCFRLYANCWFSHEAALKSTPIYGCECWLRKKQECHFRCQYRF